jgi:NADPH-dependent 2,4-dienoyl-CoA reductase/sulfur reductase-like enzyme
MNGDATAIHVARIELEREQEAADLGYKTQPYVVIVGGGQGGIVLGARLRRLGLPTIIIEKNAKPGDSWSNRYTFNSQPLAERIVGEHYVYNLFSVSHYFLY